MTHSLKWLGAGALLLFTLFLMLPEPPLHHQIPESGGKPLAVGD